MTETKYTYSIVEDTASGLCNSSRLTYEIQQSEIVTMLGRIDISGDVLDIWFKDPLSSGDETRLDTLVSNHTGEELLESCENELRWSEFSAMADNINPALLYTEPSGTNEYLIFFVYSSALIHCHITKGTADATDFENNYKADCNKKEAPRVRILQIKVVESYILVL